MVYGVLFTFGSLEPSPRYNYFRLSELQDKSKPNKLYNLVCLQKVDVHGDDPKKVDGISVTLRDINLFTTGLFGCEASAEESFHTALVRKQMTVLGKSIF